mmetsp:Transcript_38084/g.119993  ORF Transcript_38084/g.119993 Transcript_38084/m.119993 type:complete len:352 (-) Transcript_38084:134-1189(-)
MMVPHRHLPGRPAEARRPPGRSSFPKASNSDLSHCPRPYHSTSEAPQAPPSLLLLRDLSSFSSVPAAAALPTLGPPGHGQPRGALTLSQCRRDFTTGGTSQKLLSAFLPTREEPDGSWLTSNHRISEISFLVVQHRGVSSDTGRMMKRRRTLLVVMPLVSLCCSLREMESVSLRREEMSSPTSSCTSLMAHVASLSQCSTFPLGHPKADDLNPRTRTHLSQEGFRMIAPQERVPALTRLKCLRSVPMSSILERGASMGMRRKTCLAKEAKRREGSLGLSLRCWSRYSQWALSMRKRKSVTCRRILSFFALSVSCICFPLLPFRCDSSRRFFSWNLRISFSRQAAKSGLFSS